MNKGCTKTIWQTKSGRRIRVKDMDDMHLVNTIKFLRRFSLACELNAVAVADFFGLDVDIPSPEDEDPDEFLEREVPTWSALILEAEKRGLSLEE